MPTGKRTEYQLKTSALDRAMDSGLKAAARHPKKVDVPGGSIIARMSNDRSRTGTRNERDKISYADGGRVGNASKKGKTQSAPSLPGKKQDNAANKSGSMYGHPHGTGSKAKR